MKIFSISLTQLGSAAIDASSWAQAVLHPSSSKKIDPLTIMIKREKRNPNKYIFRVVILDRTSEGNFEGVGLE
jgi:hypothetical protein